MSELTFHLIPHVHWDREWYLSRSGFTARLVPLVDGLLDLLAAAPELRFHLDGQMVLIEDYLAIVPHARERVESAVARGQLGVGPWYILADHLIPSGSSHRKNLEIGIALAGDFGGPVPVLYSPDAFGHPAGLPDLAAEFGLRWAVAWRGLGRVDGVDRDLYRWKGPAGGSVLLHHLPPQGYEMGVDLVTSGPALPAAWRKLRDQLVARATTTEIPVLIGADHHAPERSLPTLRDRIQTLEPEARVRFSGFAEFFTAVEQHPPEVAEIEGELRQSAGYVWSLQGVHGSRTRMKRRHSAIETWLTRVAEPIARAADLEAAEPLLDSAWRTLLQCQFHDTICGTCADEVAREQEVRLDGVRAIADQLVHEGLDRLGGRDPDRERERPNEAPPTLVVWNAGLGAHRGVIVAETTWFREDVLVGPPGHRRPKRGSGYQPFHLIGPSGERIAVQVLRSTRALERRDSARHYPDLDQVDRVWVALLGPELPSAQLTKLAAQEGVGPPITATNPVRVAGHTLDNGLARIDIGSDGLAVLTDLVSTRSWRGLLAIEVESDRGDLYTPDIGPEAATRARVTGIRVLAAGPLLGAIETGWEVALAGRPIATGRTVVVLTADAATIEVRIELVAEGAGYRVRAALPLGGDGAVVGGPMGEIARGPGRLDDSWSDETGLPTAPAQRFLRVGTGAERFEIRIDGHFEYELSPGGLVRLTLHRAVTELSRSDLRTRRGHAGWPVATPAAAESGRHVFEMILVPGEHPAATGPIVPVWWRGSGQSARTASIGSMADARRAGK